MSEGQAPRMKLPPKFRLVLTGSTIDVITRENASAQIGWYLTRLLQGVDMPANVFDSWRLTVEIEEDMDQGDV